MGGQIVSQWLLERKNFYGKVETLKQRACVSPPKLNHPPPKKNLITKLQTRHPSLPNLHGFLASDVRFLVPLSTVRPLPLFPTTINSTVCQEDEEKKRGKDSTASGNCTVSLVQVAPQFLNKIGHRKNTKRSIAQVLGLGNDVSYIKSYIFA